MTLETVGDYALSEKLRGKIYRHKPPTLSLSQVLDRSRAYLVRWKVPLSPNLRATICNYDRDYPACWLVRWTRFAGDYPWDDFNPAEYENVCVVLHESFGLVCIGNKIYSPAPARLDVLVDRESAIKRASDCVPLVERTPYYRQARRDGFAANGLKSCELRVAVPNWLLDPKRAVWLRSSPPTETRLCWIVRFTTMDTLLGKRGLGEKEGKPLELDPPDILIYIDAASGEVVGADFT